MFTTSRTPIRRLATHGASALITAVALAASSQAAMAAAQASVIRTPQVAHVHSIANRPHPLHSLASRPKPLHSLANAPKFCHGSPC
jgi:hypothetical protein